MLSASALTTSMGAVMLLPLCLGDKQDMNAIAAITAQKNIDLIDTDFATIKSKNIP